MIDACKGLRYIHDKGFVVGSLCPQNIFYHPHNEPWGKLHVPGLHKLDDRGRDKDYSRFPYYFTCDNPIEENDDVLAAAVIVVEGLWADENKRDSFNDHVSMPLKYDHQPAKVINDLIPDFKRFKSGFRPLALVLEQIANGQITKITPLIDALTG